MSDLLTGAALALPLLLAVVLGARVLVIRRRQTDLGRQLVEQKQARADATEQSVRAQLSRELARTLHDDLGHRLTLAAVQAGALGAQTSGRVSVDLEQLRIVLADSVSALNRSVLELGGSAAEQEGLERQVERIAAGVRGTGTTMEIVTDLDSTAPRDRAQESLAATIIREGCTNALRHAPGAPLRLRIARAADGIDVDLVNAAPMQRPAVPGGIGTGISALRATLTERGGTMSSGPPAAGGWRLTARIPSARCDLLRAEQEEFAQRGRRAGRLLVALPLATAAVLVAIPVGMVLGQAALSRITPADFAAITVGQSAEQARRHLPLLDMQAPPEQTAPGTCHHHEATFTPFDRTEVYEVCLQHGVVTSTTTIPAP